MDGSEVRFTAIRGKVGVRVTCWGMDKVQCCRGVVGYGANGVTGMGLI